MISYKFEKQKAGIRILDLLSGAGETHISAPCGGHGRCGKCRVRIAGAVTPPDETERRRLSADELAAGIRLGCRAFTAGGDVEVEVEESESSSAIETSGMMTAFSHSPIRESRCGIAVDIGTTTVVVYLCELSEGKIIGTSAFQNPQRIFGADVITRIGHIIDDYASLSVQRKAIIDGINDAIASFGVDPRSIGAGVLTGNTVMLHIAAGEDPRGIANAPFTPSSLFGCSVNSRNAGINIDESADIYYMPCFAAYVGGDIATGMVAAGFDESEGVNIYIDVGTNGEMAIGGRGGITVCATAAGPAFEGAHIECGTGGIEGAIRRVAYNDGKISVDVIGGGKAVGLCGSAIIDAAAVMLSVGAIDETGRIDGDICREHNREFGHDDEKRFYITENCYLSDADIREIQLAKAAVCAGIMTLLEGAGADISEVRRFIVAGGFGSHIDPDSACAIGLFPSEARDKIEIAGNTAGIGSVLYLLSDAARARIDGITSKAVYKELSGDEFFMDEYVERMMF